MIYSKTTIDAALKESREGKNAALVLVVDDELIVADTLSTILEKSGYVVMTAYDGPSALLMAKQSHPDLVITDVVMPGMNGVDLARAICQSIAGCRILLFSGNATSRDLMGLYGGHEYGGQDYGGHEHFPLLAKPMHPTQMLEHVRVALEADPPAVRPGSRPRRALEQTPLREMA